jgi:hypothetical protein
VAVAGVIVKKLGLVEFSVERIMNWLFEQPQFVVGSAVAKADWALPALAEFLNESIGNALVMPRAWVPGETARPLQEPRYKLTVRYELQPRRLLISTSALREYLIKKELSYREFISVLEQAKVITRKQMQATLGAGTEIPGGQVWCVEINAGHEAVVGVLPVAKDNVVAMTRA